VATSSMDGAHVWDAATGKKLRTLPLVSAGVAPSPLPDLLVAYSVAEAVIWNATSGKVVHRLDSSPTDIERVAVALGGDVVVTCGSGRTIVWDTASGAQLGNFDNPKSGRGAQNPCSVAVAPGCANGFGRGVPWRQLPLLGCPIVR